MFDLLELYLAGCRYCTLVSLYTCVCTEMKISKVRDSVGPVASASLLERTTAEDVTF